MTTRHFQLSMLEVAGEANASSTVATTPPTAGMVSDAPKTAVADMNETTTPFVIITTTGIWTPDVIQRVAMLSIIMLLTLVGNISIILVLTCSKYRKRRSQVNIFIINLAIGDLTVCLVTMNSELLFVVFGEWVLGEVVCKLIVYGEVITLASTTFILMSMSFDRYMAICRPLSLSNSGRNAKRMIVTSWIMAFVVASPQLFIFVQTNNGISHKNGHIRHECESQGYTAEWQRKVYFTFMTFYILIVPSIFISFCYGNVARVVWNQGKNSFGPAGSVCSDSRRSIDKKIVSRAKIRTVKMTFCIIASFVICWTPYFVVTLIVVYAKGPVPIPSYVFVIAEVMALFNSAINPILYGCFNLKFKSSMKSICCPNKMGKHGRPCSPCLSDRTMDYSVTESLYKNRCSTSFSNAAGGNAHSTKTVMFNIRQPPKSDETTLCETRRRVSNSNDIYRRSSYLQVETFSHTNGRARGGGGYATTTAIAADRDSRSGNGSGAFTRSQSKNMADVYV